MKKNIKVKTNYGIYKVVNNKKNLKMFKDEKFDSFFVECKPAESNLGFTIALMDKKDVVEVIEE